MIPSSWISSILYKRTPDGASYLALFLRLEEDRKDTPVALLYGPEIPSWVPGLISAGTGKRSIGTAYNRLVKGKFPYQRVEGREKVQQLKEMMK